jgi:hypothetical protein
MTVYRYLLVAIAAAAVIVVIVVVIVVVVSVVSVMQLTNDCGLWVRYKSCTMTMRRHSHRNYTGSFYR